MGVYMQLRTLS